MRNELKSTVVSRGISVEPEKRITLPSQPVGVLEEDCSVWFGLNGGKCLR